MRITARVSTAEGTALAAAKVGVVAPGGTVLAGGEVRDGSLSVGAPDPMPAVWALTVDDQPVLAFPVTADAESTDLGDIMLQPEGVPWPAFHAPDGRVYGVPPAALATGSERPLVPGRLPPPGPGAPPIDFLKPVPISAIFDSTAQQLARVPSTGEGLRLTGATVTVRGLPTGSGNDFSLEFPTADLARNATGLSEVSFGLRPDPGAAAFAANPPPGQVLPDVSGYTRELALRKLAAAGLPATLASELVDGPHEVGRVVRQEPRAGQPADPNTPVRLFIGTSAGAA